MELSAYSIENGVLAYWYRLVPEAIIPEGVTKIGQTAFARCESLLSVIIPCSVMKIGCNAFIDCSSLKEIRYDGTKKQWETVEKENSWYENTRIQKVFCSDGTVELPAYSIEDGVLTRWYRLIPKVIIPEGVTKIDNFAFENSISLKEIHYDGTKEQWEAVKKEPEWNDGVPIEYIVCTDGTVKLQ